MRTLHDINYDGYVITESNYDVDAEWRDPSRIQRRSNGC